LAVALVVTCSAARANVIYETADPFGGPFGLWGFDVFERQSVGLRFTPDDDYRLSSVALWLMNNDGSGNHFGEVRVTLRNDNAARSIPGDTVYEEWRFEISAVGWDPQLELLKSQAAPSLEAGANYWIVAESDDTVGMNPVWNIASIGTGFMSIHDGGQWQTGGQGAVAATIVEGAPVAGQPGDLNCDGAIDAFDIEPFILALTDPGSYPNQHPNCDLNLADINGDGAIDAFDIEPFIGLLLP
jgi:hypothetical protein